MELLECSHISSLDEPSLEDMRKAIPEAYQKFKLKENQIFVEYNLPGSGTPTPLSVQIVSNCRYT